MPRQQWAKRVHPTPQLDGLGWSCPMSPRDDDQFRIRPGAPKQRGDAFISKVTNDHLWPEAEVATELQSRLSSQWQASARPSLCSRVVSVTL